MKAEINKFGKLSSSKSFFSIEGDIVLSCFKKAQDSNSIIVRLFNPSGSKANGKLKSYFEIKSIYAVNMNEGRIQRIKASPNELDLTIEPNKIMTLEIEI